MRATLYIAGAAIEFVGIVLVASPDLFPYAARLSAWLTRQYRRAFDRLLRGRRGVTQQVQMGGAVTGSGTLTREKLIATDATLEEKVGFLLTRDREAQRDVQALEHRVDELQKGIDPKLASLRSSMTAHVAESLDRAHHEYLALRVLGVALVSIGLTLATLGNFVD